MTIGIIGLLIGFIAGTLYGKPLLKAIVKGLGALAGLELKVKK